MKIILKTALVASVITGLLLLSECKHLIPRDWHNFDTTFSGGGKPCSTDTVYFNRDIQPILNSNCAYSGCHDKNTAAEEIILDNYKDIVITGEVRPGNPAGSKLYEMITKSNPKDVMPPPPKSPLNNDQKDLIRRWIQQGAKNNYCISCDTTKFAFAADIQPIILSNCASCHSGAAPTGNIKLTSYGEVKATVDNGKLMSTLSWLNAIKMPQGAKLPDCQINKISKWIQNGAPND